jgi:RNA polymerase sigma-70 factor, ECF subfamily
LIFSKAYKKYSDEELMRFIQGNNVPAFEELYARYSQRLLFFMMKMLNNDAQRANDLLQDLFLKLVERPDMFDVNRKFYAWIFTVAANMCRTEHRSLYKETVSTDEFENSKLNRSVDELIAQIDARVFRKHLGIALDALTYEQKETFMLRFQEGFSIQEIAEMMNCSVGTVKSRIFYTTRKLAEELQEFKPLLKI